MGATFKRLDSVHRCGSHVLPANRTSLAPSEQQLPAVFDATTFAALYTTAPDWTYAITPIPGTCPIPSARPDRIDKPVRRRRLRVEEMALQ